MIKLTSFIAEAEKSKEQKEYQALISKKLKEKGVKDLGDLNDKETKAFFAEIDKEWDGEDEVNEKKVEDDFDSEEDKDEEELKDKKEKSDAKVEDKKEDDKDEEEDEDEEEEVNEGSKFKVGAVVYNKRTNTVGIVRMEDEGDGEVKTDADGNVDVDELVKYNAKKHKDADIAPSTKKEINENQTFVSSILNEMSSENKSMLKDGSSKDVRNIREGINNLFADLVDAGHENEIVASLISEIVDTSLQQIKSNY